MTRVCWLSESFPWMGPRSGYDVLRKQLAPALNPLSTTVFRDFEGPQTYAPPFSYEADFFRVNQRSIAGNPFYDIRSYRAEIETLELLAHDKFNLLHILYGENNTSELIASIDRNRTKVVATCHQPISWWKSQHIRPDVLGLLDGLITVSSEAVKYFSQYLDRDKIFFIPHGVDVDSFHPAVHQDTPTAFGCLSVGHWMRDFSLFPALVEAVRARFPEFIFTSILSDSAKREPDVAALAQLDGVNVISGISDEELHTLYCNRMFLFLPLIDGTANNAILEAMSSGIPILSTETEGARDYLRADYAHVVSGRRAEDFLPHFVDMIENGSRRRDMGQRAREACLERFSWEHIAQQTLACYEKVIAS